jgi:hypothetical protein
MKVINESVTYLIFNADYKSFSFYHLKILTLDEESRNEFLTAVQGVRKTYQYPALYSFTHWY